MRISNFQFPNSKFCTCRNGQAVLSLILLIGGIIVLAGLNLAFLAVSFLNSSYGFQAAEKAQAVAASGAYDGLMQLARNKDFSSAGYAVAVGSDSATVVVNKDQPAVGQTTIVSTATVSNRQRKVMAVMSRNTTTSQITLVSWRQSQ